MNLHVRRSVWNSFIKGLGCHYTSNAPQSTCQSQIRSHILTFPLHYGEYSECFFRLWDEEEEAQKRSHIQNITEILSFASIPWSLWFECKNVYGQLLITGLFLTTNINSLLSATGKRNLVASLSSKSTSYSIHVLYLFFFKKSIKMGPGHVRPF